MKHLRHVRRAKSALIGVTVLSLALENTPASDPVTVPITALAFTPDGSALVSNGPRRVDVRSPEDGMVKSHFACDLPKITSLSFHPRGNILAVAGGVPGVSGEVRLFDWQTQKPLHRVTGHADLATSVAFNAAGTLLGVASADHTARVWRMADAGGACTELFTLTGHAGPVLAIAFSPGGHTIVTASADRSIKVWSTEDGHMLRTFSQHLEAVNAVAFRPQVPAAREPVPCACASGGDDRTIRIWQPEVGRMVRIIRQHRAPVLALAYAPDGRSIFAAGKEGVIRRFDADSDALIAEWPGHSDWIYSLALSPNGSKLASGDWSGTVRLRDVPGGK